MPTFSVHQDVSSAARVSKATVLVVAPELFKLLQVSSPAYDGIDCSVVAAGPAKFSRASLPRLCPDAVHTVDIAWYKALHAELIEAEVKMSRVRNGWLEGSKPCMQSA